MNIHQIETGMALILRGLGIDQKDHNYTDTPERYAKALMEMFQPKETEWATFEEDFSDFILLRGHKLWSLCPHHMLPVHLEVSIAYMPSGKVLGISKLARLLDECNNGPVLQERFTKLVIDKISEICPGLKGAACSITGVHSCMAMRGVKSQGDLVTWKLSGAFQEQESLANRFFTLTLSRKTNG